MTTAPRGAIPDQATRTELAEAIERLTAARPPLLVIVDFDGTLAVGARDPAVAHIEPAAQRALRRLARVAERRPGRVVVAVLTGRTVVDVAARVRVGGISYLGDHGLQSGRLPRGGRVGAIEVVSDAAFDRHRDPAELLAAGVARALDDPPWLFVERKGQSVAFHVRLADDIPSARTAVIDAIADVERREGLRDHGLHHYRGRSVVDLRPEGAVGKREAVAGLVARHAPGAVVVLGDELSDVDAFDGVIGARADGSIDVGVTVAVDGGDHPAPEDLLMRADLRVSSALAVGPFLAHLARAVEAAAAGA